MAALETHASPVQGEDALSIADQNGTAPNPRAQTSGSANSSTTPSSATPNVNNIAPGRYHPTNADEWLKSTYVYAEFPGSMRIEDFSKIKAARHDVDSFWQDGHIKWSLELIKSRHAGLVDVSIVSPNICNILYRVGIGHESVPNPNSTESRERLDFERTWARIVEILRDRAFVILPVNNGFKVEYISAGDEENQGQGTHWSFIVVDRRDAANPAAHYVDGMVNPRRRKNGTWKVEGIGLNGTVAGKVLCGFDAVLGLEKGKFTARTLKFVPHMTNDNTSAASDYGPCGPHLYAFLDHILTHKTTLIDPGMQHTYNDESHRGARAADFEFNSIATRAKFAEELSQLRRQQEQLQPHNSVDNLTPEVLRNLMTVDGLINLARATARSLSSSSKETKRDDSMYKDTQVPISMLQDYIKSNSYFSDIHNLEDRYRLAYEGLVAQQQQAENDTHGPPPGGIESEDSDDVGSESNTTKFYLGRYLYRNVPLDDPSIWPPHRADKKDFPKNFKHLPDFTAISDTPGVPSWINKHANINKQVDRTKNGWETLARALLHVEYKKSFLGETDSAFANCWSKDQSVFNPNKAEVVALQQIKDTKIRYGMMRLRIMRHYQGNEEVDALLKILEKYRYRANADSSKRAPSDDDGDDSQDDAPDKTNGKGDENGGSGENSDGSNDQNDVFHGEYLDNAKSNNNGDENSTGDTYDATEAQNNKSRADKNNHNQANTDAGVNDTVNVKMDETYDAETALPTSAPLGIWDFRTMDPDEIQTYITVEMRKDPRVTGIVRNGAAIDPSIISWRALCFVRVSGQDFDNESDTDCLRLWLQDPIVFTDEDRAMDWAQLGMINIIRQRMNNHYRSTALPSEEMDELDEWLTSSDEEEELDIEAEEQSQPILPTTGDKRKNIDDPTVPTKRFRLDLSSRNFLQMDIETLSLWIQEMPFSFRNHFPRNDLSVADVQRARIWLERMYGEGFEFMRKEDPLSKESLRKLGQWRFKIAPLRSRTPEGLRTFLVERLLADANIQGRLVPIPDRRAELEKKHRQQKMHGEGQSSTCNSSRNRVIDLSEQKSQVGPQPRATPTQGDAAATVVTPRSGHTKNQQQGLQAIQGISQTNADATNNTRGTGFTSESTKSGNAQVAFRAPDGGDGSDSSSSNMSSPLSSPPDSEENSSEDPSEKDSWADDDTSSSEEPVSSDDGNTTNGAAANNLKPWDNAHELPLGLLDFRTIPSAEIEQHTNIDMLSDPRLHLRNVNTTSWRAFLFVTDSGRHFGEESDANCLHIWLNDTVVFTDGERINLRQDPSRVQEIRDRMNTHYGTGPPTDMPGIAENLHDTEEDPDEERQENSDEASGYTTSGCKRHREESDGDDLKHEQISSKKQKKSHRTSPHTSEKDDVSTTDDLPPPLSTSSVPPEANASFDSQATVEDFTVDMRIGRILYTFRTNDHDIFLPEETIQHIRPTGASSLPDFAHVDFAHFSAWYKANNATMKPLLAQRGQLHDMQTARALLHMLFRRTFMHEPDANFSEVWINDPTVFNATAREELLAIENAEMSNGEIRRRMMEAYEPEMLRRIETTGFYRPGTPNAVEINVIGASRSMDVGETPAVDEALLRAPTAREASEERREMEGRAGLRRSTRKKTPSRKYEG